MTRPIPAALVLEALPKACKADAALCNSVTRYLKHFMRGSGIEFGSAEAAAGSGSNLVIPDEHGRTEQDCGAASGVRAGSGLVDRGQPNPDIRWRSSGRAVGR
jgi:hypothetical protein